MTTDSAAPLRVIGYARISDEKAESTSIARQHDIIKATAKARDWQLVGIVDDIGESASKKRLARAGLTEVRALVAAGTAEAVAVWRLDRAARNVADLAALLDEGTHVISCTEPVDMASPMGRAMAEVLQVFARLEAETTRIRVTGSVRHLKEVGRWAGGVVPYGYRSATGTDGGRTLGVDAAEAAEVRGMADAVLSGASLYAVSQELNARGVATRKGGPWSIQAVRQVLTGDPILGRVKSDGELLRDAHGFPREVFPPVLPLDDVERIRAILTPTPRGQGRRRAARLASGLLSCFSCGATLRAKANGKGLAVFACSTRSAGRTCAAPVSVGADVVEEYLGQQFVGAVGWMPETRVEERAPEVAGLAAVVEAIRTTAQAMTHPGADVLALSLRMSELHARRAELEAAPSEAVVEYVQTGRTVAEAWADGDVSERRGLLSAALAGPVVVSPGQRGRRGLDVDRLDVPFRWLSEG